MIDGTHERPLQDISVLEIIDELTEYAGWLLADLGATVTRLRLPAASDAAEWWPLNLSKALVALDPLTPEGEVTLADLIAASDVILQPSVSDGPAIAQLDPATLTERRPDIIQVILSPFGLGGPKSSCGSTDLVRLAAGGLLWLGGYADAEPVAPYGNQSALCTAIFGAIAVLLATLERDRTGRGSTIDVSAQEVMVQALETSLAEYELLGHVRGRNGGRPREAGTGIYRCADGYVSMVAGRLGTASAWRRLREWMVEEHVRGAEQLMDDEWESLAFRQRPDSIERFGELFAAFIANRSKSELYAEAQRRSIALAPVNTPAEVRQDPQLVARGFFREVTHPETGDRAVVPSAPYRGGPAPATAVHP
jgi:benzylsuccinate CoA-transferase BbsE subunit